MARNQNSTGTRMLHPTKYYTGYANYFLGDALKTWYFFQTKGTRASSVIKSIEARCTSYSGSMFREVPAPTVGNL